MLTSVLRTIKFLSVCGDELFNVFSKECKYALGEYGPGDPPCCSNEDNTDLVEVIGGGYFKCSAESCPLINKD